MIDPQNRPVTLRDLAAAAGVTHSTVSRALRDDPRIGKATRLRIKTLADKMHYRPDPMLSALMVYRSANRPTAFHGKIAVVDPDYQGDPDHTLNRILPGIQDQADKLGYQIEVFPIEPDLRSQKRLAGILRAQGVRGVLFGPLSKQWRDVSGFDWSLFPIVSIGYSLRSPALHFVAQDHDNRCQMVYRRIREMGFSRIGYCNRHAIENNNRHLMLGAYLKSLYLDGLSSEKFPPLLYDRFDDLDPIAWLDEHRFDAVICGMVDEFHIRLQRSRYPKSKHPYLAAAILSTNRPQDMKYPGGIESLTVVGVESVNLLHQLICHGSRGIPTQRQAVLVEGEWNPGKIKPTMKNMKGMKVKALKKKTLKPVR